MTDNRKELSASWQWLNDQYTREKESLDKYMESEKCNMEYAMRRKAFLSAWSKHMADLRLQVEYLRNVEKILNDKVKQEAAFSQMLYLICDLHGINVQYFISKGKMYLSYLVLKATWKNAVRLPDVFQKHFPKSEDNLFTK